MCKQMGIDFFLRWKIQRVQREAMRVCTWNLRSVFNFSEEERSIHNEFVEFSIWNGFVFNIFWFFWIWWFSIVRIIHISFALVCAIQATIFPGIRIRNRRWRWNCFACELNWIEMEIVCYCYCCLRRHFHHRHLHQRWRFEKSIVPAMIFLVRAHIEQLKLY